MNISYAISKKVDMSNVTSFLFGTASKQLLPMILVNVYII